MAETGKGRTADVVLLAARAMQNDEAAWTELYDLSYRSIHFIAREFFRNDEDAADAEQEAYLKMYRSIGSLSEPGKFLAWAKQIATNVCIDIKRKHRDFTFSDVEGAAGLAEEDIALEVEDLSVDFRPEAQMDIAETSRLIRGMLDELPDEQRVSLDLLYGSEMSVKDIAASMGVSENTVKSRLRYGRIAMEAKIEALKEQGTKLYLIPVGALLRSVLHGEIESQAASGAGAVIAKVVFAAAAGGGDLSAGVASVSGTATVSVGAAGAAHAPGAVSAAGGIVIRNAGQAAALHGTGAVAGAGGSAASASAAVTGATGTAKAAGIVIRSAGYAGTSGSAAAGTSVSAATGAAVSSAAASASAIGAGAATASAGAATASTCAATMSVGAAAAAAGTGTAVKGIIAAVAIVVAVGGGTAAVIHSGSSGTPAAAVTAESDAEASDAAGTADAASGAVTGVVPQAAADTLQETGAADAIIPGWNQIGGDWYYYDEQLVPVRGWLQLGEEYYYLAEDSGIMQVGWQNIGGADYYLDEASGVMLHDCWVDGYYLSGNGDTHETNAMYAYGEVLARYLYGYAGSVGYDLNRQSWHEDTGEYRLRYLLKDANGDGIRELCVVSEVPADEGDGAQAGYFDEAVYSYVGGELKAPYLWYPAMQFESLSRPDVAFNNRASWDWLNADLELCGERAHYGAMWRSRLSPAGVYEDAAYPELTNGIYGLYGDECSVLVDGVTVYEGSPDAINFDDYFDYGPDLDRDAMTPLTLAALQEEFNTVPEALGLSMQPSWYSRLEISRAGMEQEMALYGNGGTSEHGYIGIYGGTESSDGYHFEPYRVIDHGTCLEIREAIDDWLPLFVSENAIYRNWQWHNNGEELTMRELLAANEKEEGKGRLFISYGATVEIRDGIGVLIAQNADE